MSADRDPWLGCMNQALGERSVARALAERLMTALFDTADWMRNRGG